MALRGARRDGAWANPEWLIYGALLGAGAGCLLFLLDGQKSARVAGEPSSLIGRVMAALSIPSSILPYAGLVVGGISLFMNRRVSGWPLVVTWIGLVLSVIVSGIITLAIIMVPPSV